MLTHSYISKLKAKLNLYLKMEFKVRQAKLEDAENISNIWQIICAERIYTSVSKTFTAQQEREYLSSLSKREAIFIAEVDNQVVGFQTLDLWSKIIDSFNHAGSIGTVLRPEWRGKGIGYVLANHTFDFARINDYKKIVIYVRKGNERTIKFYLNLGFLIKGELQHHVKIDNTYENEVFMEKFL